MIISGHQHIKLNILMGYGEGPRLSDPTHRGERSWLALQDPGTTKATPWHVCPSRCVHRGWICHCSAAPSPCACASSAAAHPAASGDTSPSAGLRTQQPVLGKAPVEEPACTPVGTPGRRCGMHSPAVTPEEMPNCIPCAWLTGR